MKAIELAEQLESPTFNAGAMLAKGKEIADELRRLALENGRLQGQCAKCAQLKAQALTMVHDYEESC
jgi:hypothetical protein